MRKAKANPLAVGLMALGAGWLLASLIPVSEKEKEVAEQTKEAAQPLVHGVAEAAKDGAAELKGPAADAVDAVRKTAATATERLKDEASTSAANVRSEATSSAAQVKGAAQDERDTAQPGH